MTPLNSKLTAVANGANLVETVTTNADAVWITFRDPGTDAFAFAYGVVFNTARGKTFQQLGITEALVGTKVQVRAVDSHSPITIVGPNGDATIGVQDDLDTYCILNAHGHAYPHTISFDAETRAVKVDLMVPAPNDDTKPIYCTDNTCPEE